MIAWLRSLFAAPQPPTFVSDEQRRRRAAFEAETPIVACWDPEAIRADRRARDE